MPCFPAAPLRAASFALAASLISATMAFAGDPVDEPKAAHTLADKFSNATGETSKADEQARRRAEEADMLARARAEAEARAKTQGPIADHARATPTEDGSDAAAKLADQQARERQMALEAAREAESRALAEKLRLADEARRQKAAAAAAAKPVPESQPLPAPSTPPMGLGQHDWTDDAAPDASAVTILLVMEPGTKGIRRFNKTADPVLCQGARCYVSTGTATTARNVPRAKALGAGNTLGQRAGACRRSLTCAFRNVRLADRASEIQPVDLKVLVHDRRTPRTVSGDRSCRVVAGGLTCGRTVVAPGYRAWIVPEAVAAAAGPAALKAALDQGLPERAQRDALLEKLERRK